MGAIENLGSSLLYRLASGVNQTIVAGKITAWAKSAGVSSVNVVQAVAADQPTADALNGVNAAKLVDSSDYLEDAANPDMGGLAAWTNLVVCFYQSNGIAANQPIRAPANSSGCGITSHNLSSQYCKVGLDFGGISKTTGWHIVAAIFNGAGVGNAARLKMWLDMVPTVVTFTGTIPPVQTTPTVGSRVGWPGLSGVGDKVADVVMVNRALTDAELLACTQQLALTYNLPLAGYTIPASVSGLIAVSGELVMPKAQFQSTEAMVVTFPPFIDVTGSQIIGSDTATLTIKKPDNAVSSVALVWDTDVKAWSYTIVTGSYMQGQWKFKAVSSVATAYQQNATAWWGDYVDTIADIDATIGTPANGTVSADIAEVESHVSGFPVPPSPINWTIVNSDGSITYG